MVVKCNEHEELPIFINLYRQLGLCYQHTFTLYEYHVQIKVNIINYKIAFIFSPDEVKSASLSPHSHADKKWLYLQIQQRTQITMFPPLSSSLSWTTFTKETIKMWFLLDGTFSYLHLKKRNFFCQNIFCISSKFCNWNTSYPSSNKVLNQQRKSLRINSVIIGKNWL